MQQTDHELTTVNLVFEEATILKDSPEGSDGYLFEFVLNKE